MTTCFERLRKWTTHSKFLDLISASICIIFLDVATRNTAEEGISYLGMGCGVFGRLTVLDNEVPFANVLELARTAQQIKGKQAYD